MGLPNIGDGVRVERDLFAALGEGVKKVLGDGVQVSDSSAEPGFGESHVPTRFSQKSPP